MDRDHLINTVNKVSMGIERRRECLLELRKRFDKDYTYTCGHCQLHTHEPSKRVYDGRMFEDDWYDSGKEDFYGIPANYDKAFSWLNTNENYKLVPGYTVELACNENKYNVYSERQLLYMGTLAKVVEVSDYWFKVEGCDDEWVYADIQGKQEKKQMVGSLLFTGTKKQMRQFATALDYNDIPLKGRLTDIGTYECLELVDGAELYIGNADDWGDSYMINLNHGFSVEALLQVGDTELLAEHNVTAMQAYDRRAGIDTAWQDDYEASKQKDSVKDGIITSDVVYFKESHKQHVKDSFGVNFVGLAFKLTQSEVKGRHTLTCMKWPNISKDISTTLVTKYLTDKPDPNYHTVHIESVPAVFPQRPEDVQQFGSKIDLSKTSMKENNKPKGVTMKSAITTQMDNNKAAAIMAAEITAGKVLNNKVVSIIKPKMPMMVRGYMDSPLASVAIANLVGIALKQYMPNNDKATKVSELMLNASALQLMESFNIEQLLDELLAGVKLPETKKEVGVVQDNV